MRILYISASSAVGGAQQALYNLASEMKARGHEVGVVLPDSKGVLYGKLQDAGCELFASERYVMTLYPMCYMPWKRRRANALLKENITRVREYIGHILDEFRPDIVHTNVGPLDIAPAECAKRGIPHVWHLREYQRGMRFYPSADIFRKLVHESNNHCIAISNGISDYWELDAKKDRVIYDGVIPDTPGRPSSPDGGYFLFAGRVEKIKEVLPMLKAFRRYRSKGGGANLLIAGKDSGFYALRCKLYAKLFLKDSVSFMGVCDGIGSLLDRAAALIAPCRCEGFGFTVVEAMHRNCPVIGFDACGIKEQFDKGLALTGDSIGMRFDSTYSLSERMLEVTKDGFNPADMTERALRTVMESYTISHHTSQVEAFYKDILGHE